MSNNTNQDKYLSDKDLAERYSVHRATPWRWVKSGDMPKPVKLGGATRWRLSDLVAWENTANN